MPTKNPHPPISRQRLVRCTVLFLLGLAVFVTAAIVSACTNPPAQPATQPAAFSTDSAALAPADGTYVARS